MKKFSVNILRFLRKIKRESLNYLFYYKNKLIYKKKPEIYVLMEPVHDNIGDQGIVYGQRRFINDNFKDYTVHFVSEDKYNYYSKSYKKIITTEDIIFLHGGGNFGNEYMHHEITRRDIIKSFKQNRIILFPQTIHFKDTKQGKIELENSIKIYSECEKLVLIAREQESFKIMKQFFIKNQVLLVPDIVLYLNEKSTESRKGAITCFRNDDEVVLSKLDKIKMTKILSEKFDSVIETDMRCGHSVKEKDRITIVKNKLLQFQKSELVITDRLHGMIFSAITGTPCIVFSNYNHKIKGTYDWIKSLDYIKYLDNVEDFSKVLADLDLNKSYTYSNENFISNYLLIKNLF